MREMRVERAELLSMAVASSKVLSPVEKETCMNLLGTELNIHVLSYHPTVIRGLLRQLEFSPDCAYVEKQGRREVVVGISGTLPVSCLHVGASRRRKTLSGVFSRRTSSRSVRKRVAKTHSKMREGNLATPSEGRAGSST